MSSLYLGDRKSCLSRGFGYCGLSRSSSSRLTYVCDGSLLFWRLHNQCGHVVVFYSNPGHSRHILWEQVHMKMMWFADALLLLFSSQSLLKPLSCSQLCLCSWKSRQDYLNTPPPHIQELTAGDHFLRFLELSCTASGSLEL